MSSKLVGITFASTMLFATITSGLLLSSSSTHATDDSAVTVTEITVPSSCSMTANVSTPHVADIVNGNRAINIGKTTLSTFCNDPGGFAIYAIGYTNNELGSTDVIASNNTDTIATGNTAPSNNSSWGMKVVNSSSSSFPATITPYFNVATNDGYVAVPSTFTLMASRNSGTAMNSATLLDTTYGAYISSTQPVGEYNGQVLYTMVHPSSAAGPNAGTMFEAAFLMQPTPPAKKTVGSNSYYKMQDMTPDICTVMSIGAEGQMVDDRDDKIYWVLKAKDGKCWMTQNLDHDIVTTANFYTPQNTDVDATWTASAATLKTIDSSGNFTGWSNENNIPVSADPGDWYWTGTYYNDACTTGCNYLNGVTEDKFSTTPYSENGTHGHVGNSYNWTASVAVNNSSNLPSGEVGTSICPAGWRMPEVTNEDYTSLLNAYNAFEESGSTRDEQMTRPPLYFVRNGLVFNEGVLDSSGRVGYYWIGTAQPNNNTSGMAFTSGLIFPQYTSYPRYYGFSVRCVARTGTEQVGVDRAFQNAGKTKVTVGNNQYYKMQDMDASICSNIIVGKTGSLVDTRDNTIYTIGKLDDNKCWLLDNLSLNLTNQSVLNNLDSTNTNASSESLEYLRGERIRNPVADPNGKYATAGVTNWTSGYSHSAPLVNMSNVNAVPTDTISTANGWKIGGYYNYCAANAGSYCYGNGTSSVAITGINSTEDICPSGWRLGSTGVNGDYQVLANIISGTTGDITTNEAYTAYRNALQLPLSGYRNTDGTNVGVGSYGYFWTLDSHPSGVGAIYRILAHPSTTISLGSAANAFYGFSVRCIAK